MAWELTGNGQINPETHFAGTTDKQPFIIKTDSNERLRASSDGKVGIGTTNPKSQLHIDGGDNWGQLSIWGTVGADLFLKDPDSRGDEKEILLRNQDGKTSFMSLTDGGGIKNTVLTMQHSSGYVGIGTTSPSLPLHVRKAGDGDLFTAEDGLTGLGFKINLTSTPPRKINFAMNPDGSGYRNALTLDWVGNVGIETTNPAAKLHVFSVEPQVRIESPGDRALIQFAKAGALKWDFGVGTGAGNDDFWFGDLSAYRMVLQKGTGNVGIETTNPAAKLHVLSVEPQVRIESPGDRALIQFAKAGALQWDFGVGTGAGNNDFWFGDFSAYRLVLQKGTGNVGIGTTNPGAQLHVSSQGYSTVRLESVGSDVQLNIKSALGHYPHILFTQGETSRFEMGKVPNNGNFYFNNNVQSGEANAAMVISPAGNVGIGTTAPSEVLEVHGNILVSGDVLLNGADCAEEFDVEQEQILDPGTVMVICDEDRLRQCTQAYDKKVAGVVSGAGNYGPAIILDKKQSQNKRVPLALTGKVFVKVDAGQVPIEVGDLLTTSSTPGYAMKAADHIKAFGAILGKALKPLAGGKGLIPVLVTLH